MRANRLARMNDQPGSSRRIFLVVADDSPEMRVALRYASLRALHTGGRVALFRVIDPTDFQHWTAVGNLMRAEARTEAEMLLQELSAQVVELTGEMPALYISEGDPKTVLLELIDEAPGISVLVLAAAESNKGPGPLISFLTKRVIGRMRIPVIIVPGRLSDEELDAIG